MKLENILDKFLENKNNYIEFYENTVKRKKYFSDLKVDALNMLSFLKSCKLKRKSRIGILGENSYSWILIDIACYLGGYISVPIHDNITDINLIEKIYSDLYLSLIFIDENIVDYDLIQQNKKIKSYILNRVISNIYKNISDDISIPKEDETISIISTSGTTAIPKYFSISSLPFNDFMKNAKQMFDFNNDDKLAIFLPLSHYGQRIYLYGAIIYGYNIVMCTPQNIQYMLKNDKPTIIIAVPYFYETIYETFQTAISYSIKNKLIYKSYFWLKKYLPMKLNQKMKNIIFNEMKEMLGGKIRIMVTGSAPISKKIIEFYNFANLPLYEGYGTSETGIVSLNYPGNFKIGSVGKLVPNKEVFFDNEGKIYVRGNACWAKEYLNVDKKQNSNVFLNNDYISTGDIGYMDEDGFLYIEGRKKEWIVLSNGKKVNPKEIENVITNSKYINHCVVYGDKEAYLTAIIFPLNKNINKKDIKNEIDLFNKQFPRYAQIKKFIIAKEICSKENGMLTNNMKINRMEIYKLYKSELASIYNKNYE